jgi:hypothetical protein
MPPELNTDNVVLLGKEYSGSTVMSEKYGNIQTIRSDMPIGKGGHYGYPDFPPISNVGGGFYRRGFQTDRGRTATASCWRGGALTQHYEGCFYADPLVGSFGFPSENINAEAWGATAYDKLKPTRPTFAGLNAIYELREVPEQLRQRFLPNLAGIGNYWLALKFGWEPLLNDIRNTVDFQRKAEKKLKWLLSRDGKPTRQSCTLLDTSTETPGWSGVNYGALQPVLVTQYYAEEPSYIWKRTDTEKVWANGRFRFWLPSGPRDIAWKRRLMAELFGLYPSPKVIYNMLPWSWLADWFTNAGDCLSMLDTGVADRLCADYWYVMHEKTGTIHYDCKGKFYQQNGSTFELTASVNSTQFLKYRTAGDPFGFNVNPSGLSPMQWSILGALGLSRSGH